MPTRRRFLDVLLASTAAATVGSILYPVLRYLRPLPTGAAGGPTTLDDQALQKLERESFVIVPVSGKRVLVFLDPDGKVRALDARCTHEGCTVRYVRKESVVWCACHNARFDMDGRVLSGPPPRPLPRYTVLRDEDGDVVVSESTA